MAFFDIFKKKQDTPPTGEQAQKQQEELSAGLEKTKTGLFSKLARAVAGRSTIDAGVLDDLEEVLISSDVGVETTVKIIRRIEERVARDKYMNAAELRGILRDEIAALMEQSHASTKDFGLELPEGTPYVLMVVGVNGAGKTTTFYMVVGLVVADDGQIRLDGQDITHMPIYKRARMGLSYLPQEASVFRKLSVEDNVRAILELQEGEDGKPLSKDVIEERLDQLLEELQIQQHVVHQNGFQSRSPLSYVSIVPDGAYGNRTLSGRF